MQRVGPVTQRRRREQGQPRAGRRRPCASRGCSLAGCHDCSGDLRQPCRGYPRVPFCSIRRPSRRFYVRPRDASFEQSHVPASPVTSTLRRKPASPPAAGRVRASSTCRPSDAAHDDKSDHTRAPVTQIAGQGQARWSLHPGRDAQFCIRLAKVSSPLGPRSTTMRRARRELAAEDPLGQRILQVLLDRALQRPGAVLRVPARLGQEVLGAVGHLDRQIATRQARREPLAAGCRRCGGSAPTSSRLKTTISSSRLMNSGRKTRAHLVHHRPPHELRPGPRRRGRASRRWPGCGPSRCCSSG